MVNCNPLTLLHCRLPPYTPAVAFLGGTLADTLLSLQLPAPALAALFLPALGPLPLAVPLAADLALCNFSAAEATTAALAAASDPYSSRDTAATAADPTAPGHTATRLSVLAGTQGSVLEV